MPLPQNNLTQTPEVFDKDKKKDKDKDVPWWQWGLAGGAAGLGAAASGLGYGMLSQKDYSTINNFRGLSKQWANNATSPRNTLQDYITQGSKAVNTRPFGFPATDVMRTLRSSSLAPEQHKWGPESEKHYNAFSRGPASAYLRYLDEYASGDHNFKDTWSNYRGQINTLFGNKAKVDGTEVSDALGAAPTAPEKKHIYDKHWEKLVSEANTRLPNNIKNTTKRIHDYANNLAKLQHSKSVDQLSPEQQTRVYEGLDDHIKRFDNDLWKVKQHIDSIMGTKVPGGVNWYKKDLIDPIMKVRQVARVAGPIIAAVGVGGAAYLIRKALRKDEDEDEQEKKSSDFNRYNYNPFDETTKLNTNSNSNDNSLVQASLEKPAGYWSELVGNITTPVIGGLGGAAAGSALGGSSVAGKSLGATIGGTAGAYLPMVLGSLGALTTPTRSTKQQAKNDTGKLTALKDILIPGHAPYNAYKRIGYAIRNPELQIEKIKSKYKDKDEEKDEDKQEKKSGVEITTDPYNNKSYIGMQGNEFKIPIGGSKRYRVYPDHDVEADMIYTGLGSGVGGVLGGLIGDNKKDRIKNILLGLVGGGAAGYGTSKLLENIYTEKKSGVKVVDDPYNNKSYIGLEGVETIIPIGKSRVNSVSPNRTLASTLTTGLGSGLGGIIGSLVGKDKDRIRNALIGLVGGGAAGYGTSKLLENIQSDKK